MKNKFLILVVLLATCNVVLSFAVPPSLGELRYRLISPFYLGGGAHLTRNESPHGTYLNPAIAAGFQRFVLDVNYINLQGLADVPGMGHSANIGISIPTPGGVFTSTIGFLDTSVYKGSDLDMGTSGFLNLAFSKELYSDLWFGVGLVGDLGEIDSKFQGGGALNLGFLHLPNNIFGLENFSWGMSITGIGYRLGSNSRGYFDAVPGNITPGIGINFDLFRTEKFRLAIRTDVRAPSITDLWAGAAADLYLGTLARLSLSTSLTVRDAFSGNWQTLIPSATLGFNFSFGKGDSKEDTTRTELDIQAVAAPLYAGVWGFGAGIKMPFGVRDSNPPKITVDYEEPIHISPNHDGNSDALIFDYTVKDERYITAYRFVITDPDGNIVRTYLNKDERPENESLQNLWIRLMSPKVGTPLPGAFRWDGSTDSGSEATDGEYFFTVQFSDDNGNIGIVGPFETVVDTKRPNIEIEGIDENDLIFSPDGDNSKDVLVINQSGSLENQWQAEIRDSSDQVIKNWILNDTEPSILEWDGRTDEGDIAFDGVYKYVITGTDKAGNTNDSTIGGIIIDTTRPETAINIDRRIFSPITQGQTSSILLRPDLPVKTGVDSWKLLIVDDKGDSVRSWNSAGNELPQQSFVFNGKDDKGKVLPEGLYVATMRVQYVNGFHPESSSPPFEVDTTEPKASVKANWNIFSPSGDSQRKKVTFSQTSSSENKWIGQLSNEKGIVVKKWEWVNNAPAELEWDGRDESGQVVPDGTYDYVLLSVDLAGNPGAAKPISVSVDTSRVSAILTASVDFFGPTGNGKKDTVVFYPGAQKDVEIADWKIEIRDSSNRIVRSWNGDKNLIEQQIWDGLNDNKQLSPDGQYYGELTINYVKGESATARTEPIGLDTKVPELSANAEYVLFSPNGDGQKDVIKIKQSSSSEYIFEAKILDSENRIVRSFVWPEKVAPLEWDGRDQAGNILPDGTYMYEVTGRDLADNESRVQITDIRIDTAPTPVYLTISKDYFKSGESEPEAWQSFKAVVPNTEGVNSWKLAIMNRDDQEIYSTEGQGLPSTIEWDGKNKDDQPVNDVVQGVLTVIYEKGSRPISRTRAFVADAMAPVVTVDLNPVPFSPDDDGADDDLLINLSVKDLSPIQNWSMEIFDPRNKLFKTYTGEGVPSEQIIWDGRSDSSEFVESAEEYPYNLTITDAVGLNTSVTGEISVDVLVVRDGDRLKILINNLTFMPNSKNLTSTGDEGKKNIAVLERLSKIMKKYGSYGITVEGHAASLKWANPEEAKREQENILVPLSLARAQTVLSELTKRGISSKRITAVGVGGAKPIVEHGNAEERWRNRRVEFYLDK